MKTIGLIGGLSWEATDNYCRLLNDGIQARKGGRHAARLLLSTLDPAEIDALLVDEHWTELGRKLAHEARRLENAGVDCVLLASNTLHKTAEQIEATLGTSLLHIADTAAEAVKHAGLHRIGLIGTRFTMEQSFYAGRLAMHHGLEVLVPPLESRELLHQVIFNELVLGRCDPTSHRHLVEIVADLVSQGAQGVIVGCTEIGPHLMQADSPVPLFDSARLHAAAAVHAALDVG